VLLLAAETADESSPAGAGLPESVREPLIFVEHGMDGRR
jgi:hypothetical protein